MIRYVCHVIVGMALLLLMMHIATVNNFTQAWSMTWGIFAWCLLDLVEWAFNKLWPKRKPNDTTSPD